MNKKAILGGLLGIFLVIFILSLIFTPPVPFHYLFGTIDYSTLLFLVVLILLIIFIPSFDEKRESKIYLDTNGNLDVETPREYKPIKVTPVSKILGRANIYGQKNLDYFAYNDGKVSIRNSKGDEIFGPLGDLEYSYKMDKNKATDEWYIYQFKIKDKDGNTVQFNRHDTLFNDEEYADIEMLLSLSGTVNESKISKLTRKLDSVLSVVQELDFSNISSSAIELAGTTATEKITNKAGEIAKKRIYDKLTDKKKSLFQKIKQYFWWILLGLAVICIIWYNIDLWSEASHYDSEEYYEHYSEDDYGYYSEDDYGYYSEDEYENQEGGDYAIDDGPQDIPAYAEGAIAVVPDLNLGIMPNNRVLFVAYVGGDSGILEGTYIKNNGAYIIDWGSGVRGANFISVIHDNTFYTVITSYFDEEDFWTNLIDNDGDLEKVVSFDSKNQTLVLKTTKGTLKKKLSNIPSTDKYKVFWQ